MTYNVFSRTLNPTQSTTVLDSNISWLVSTKYLELIALCSLVVQIVINEHWAHTVHSKNLLCHNSQTDLVFAVVTRWKNQCDKYAV